MINFAEVAEQGSVGAAEVISALNTVILTLAGVIAIIVRNKDKKAGIGKKCSEIVEPKIKTLGEKIDRLNNLFTDENSAFKRQLDDAFDNASNVRRTVDNWMRSDEDQQARLKIFFNKISSEIAELKAMVEADTNCDQEIAKTVEAMWEIIREFGS